ncbi:PGPGW domain-containing protein [Kineococcus glutinatus]|uniref:Transmembrane protein PGPGW n=1 Tax=Kineococcus glutinatus TaxID=1070872 RepID=A0ABP9I3J5_9ACTN
MKKTVVTVVGALLVVAGAALVVLPGPGLVLVAAGLAVLATQFPWARPPLRWARRKSREGVDELRRSGGRAVFAVACAAVTAGVGVLSLAGVRVPLVGTATAVLLVLSGLFLVGVVAWARAPHRGRGAGSAASRRPRSSSSL